MSQQDEKSQHKNLEKAIRVLRSRLYEAELAKKQEADAAKRKSMVRSGDRSAKIRTYNWPQGRVTDHRLEGDDKNHALERVIGGDLDPAPAVDHFTIIGINGQYIIVGYRWNLVLAQRAK